MPDLEYNEYDSPDENDNNIYDPEEKSLTQYNIILCELYNDNIHGSSGNSQVKYHYLVNCRFKEFDIEFINDISNELNDHYLSLFNGNYRAYHSIYKNYRNIITREDYIKPEIAECIYLETQECVAILKTFWIRLIQRAWKTVFKKRKEIILLRYHPISLRVRELTGKWPNNCLNYPGLKGMLVKK
jgi:hypothetical protein